MFLGKNKQIKKWKSIDKIKHTSEPFKKMPSQIKKKNHAQSVLQTTDGDDKQSILLIKD